MPVPHDFYAPWSDEPRLHNRHHSRPYVEPDWQAHDAGHQLPVLSTIGRGPRGAGLQVANYVEDDKSYSFDLTSDLTNEVVAHVGPIPTGEVSVSEAAGIMTVVTNQLSVDGNGQRTVRKVTKKITLPVAEAGSRIYTNLNPVTRSADDVYYMDAHDLVYFDTRRVGDLPEVRTYDFVIFKATDGQGNDFLMFGDVFNADDQSSITVASHMNIPIENLTGAPGRDGTDGQDGEPGVSCYHLWDDTTLSITSAAGTSSANLKGETGDPGNDGESAYDIAVDNGFIGTEAAWLASLKGDQGIQGEQGPQGAPGVFAQHLNGYIEEYNDGLYRLVIEDSDFYDNFSHPVAVMEKYYVTVDNPEAIPLCLMSMVEIQYSNGHSSMTMATNWVDGDDPSFMQFAAVYHIILSYYWVTDDLIVEDLATYAKITDTVWETVPQNEYTTGIGVGTILEFHDTSQQSRLEYYVDNDSVIKYPNNQTTAYSATSGYYFIIGGGNHPRGDSSIMLRLINSLANGNAVHFSMNDNTFIVTDIVAEDFVYIYVEPLTWNALDDIDMTPA